MGDYEVRELNLADLESVRAFAGRVERRPRRPDQQRRHHDGAGLSHIDDFELHIGTNHLGPFALTNLLLPHITDRVVTVSSILHRRGRIHLEDLHFDSGPTSR